MKTKVDFITDLLSNKKLHTSQKEKLFALVANDLKGDEDEIRKIWLEIETIKGKKKDNQSSNILFHKPKEVAIFLNLFRQNTALKYSTHSWDRTDFLSSIGSFLDKLNKEKIDYKFSEIFNYNRHLYNLLNYFLFKPNQEIENGIPKYGWLQDVKIGWQFPNDLIREWCMINYDKPFNYKIKYPMEFPIPVNLKPLKRINGKEIVYFEDVVNLFKTEIQFRGEERNLFHSVNSLLKQYHLYSYDINILEDLDFYTYTRGFINALDSIFNLFERKNESKKEISISIEKDIESISILITQLDSFPSKILEDPNRYFNGDSIGYINHIFSLCDYSIISKFNTNQFLEIQILTEDIEAELDGNNVKKINSSFSVKKIEAKTVKGFTHKFKFYI